MSDDVCTSEIDELMNRVEAIKNDLKNRDLSPVDHGLSDRCPFEISKQQSIGSRNSSSNNLQTLIQICQFLYDSYQTTMKLKDFARQEFLILRKELDEKEKLIFEKNFQIDQI